MEFKKKVAIMAPVAGWAMMLTGVASASNAYQGDDVSYGVSGNTRVQVCDKEADGYGVHADADSMTGSSFRVDDQNGSAAGCNNTAYMGSISRHRTVEERPAWYQPDVKGDWNNH